MKIIVAGTSTGNHTGRKGYVEALCNWLDAQGHQVQPLDLPAIDAPGHLLTNIASYRLMNLEASTDALICVDAGAAILRHSRKLVWLLDRIPFGQVRTDPGQNDAFDRSYGSKVFDAAIAEADALFAPTRFALQALTDRGLGKGQLLLPLLAEAPFDYPRHRGSELLVIGPVEEPARLDLLLDCLAQLPDRFRLRWTAAAAPPAVIARLRNRADDRGVGQRLVIDMRSVEPGEWAYMLANAAALVELTPNAHLIPDWVQHALQRDVEVVAFRDGGGLTEIVARNGVARLAEPSTGSLAKALAGAGDSPATRKVAKPLPGATSWSPLLKALAK